MNAYRTVLYVVGLFTSVLGIAMTIPAILSMLQDGHYWPIFVDSAAITLFFGGLLIMAFRPEGLLQFSTRDTFIVTTLSWAALCFFASIPFFLSDLNLTPADCLFETTAALTTTGSTVITDLNNCPFAILLWRAILQWLGGIGIIVTALMALPALKIGGMQLFRRESSDHSDKSLPRISQVSNGIVLFYIFITVLCALCLWLAGMSLFDAICHAMSTVSTGGLSTKDASICAFDNFTVEAIIMFFMLVGSCTLSLFVRFWHGHYGALFKDVQVRAFLAMTLVASVSISLWLWIKGEEVFLDALRYGFFNTISMITTTGFASTNYGQWAGFPMVLFLCLNIIGGCTGSTAGGFKVFRMQVMLRGAMTHLQRLMHPHAVYVPIYQNEKVPSHVMDSVFSFAVVYILSCFCLTLLLSLFSLDFMTCLSASIAAISNIGPGIGTLIGPSSNYASLPEGVKWLLSLGMLIGRLELITVLILFLPSFWRE